MPLYVESSWTLYIGRLPRTQPSISSAFRLPPSAFRLSSAWVLAVRRQAAACSPALASVALPGDPLAFAAADLLLDLIAGSEAPGAPVLLPETLVERASLGPPG